MTKNDLLLRLDGGHHTTRGDMRRCPAHDDRSPSLSITERDGKILLHCFAGCRVEDICAALSLSLKDLFFDTKVDPREAARRADRREWQRREREHRQNAEGLTLDACKASERFIESRRELDISQWSDAELTAELNALADAYELLERERL